MPFPSVQKSTLSQKGQALVEMALALPICLLMLWGLALSFERAFWYFYGDHLLYETLICSSSHPKYQCIHQAEQNFKYLNLMNRKFTFSINSHANNPSGRLTIELPIQLSISKKIKIIL